MPTNIHLAQTSRPATVRYSANAGVLSFVRKPTATAIRLGFWCGVLVVPGINTKLKVINFANLKFYLTAIV
ncbi:MAG: hypothetical protein ACRDE5_18715 [Ginsengibacter sp.]